MPGSLAIVAFRGLISGEASGSIDIQTRWFDSIDFEHVRRLIRAAPIHCYKNDDDETVSWELVEIFAIEEFTPGESGAEVVGFIVSTDELAELARPSSQS